MKPITVLSLFDGMSCGQIALERAGIPVKKYYASEIDKYAIKVTQCHYPDTVQLGDINNWKEWDIETPDLIIAGSPCQGFSKAGHGLNFDDPRSKLFFVFCDILDYWKKKNPKLKYMLENVKMKKEWKDIITNKMKVEPVLINSALLSAQNRQRLYWANFPITQPEDKKIFLKDIVEHGEVDREKSYTIDANYFKGGSPKYLERTYHGKAKRQVVFEHQSHKRAMVKVQGAAIRNQVTKRGVEKQLNIRKDEKSNAVVPSYTAKLNGMVFVGGLGDKDWAKDGKKLSRNYPQGRRVYSDEGKASSLTSQGVGSVGGYTGIYQISVYRRPHGYMKEDKKVMDIYPSLVSQDPSTKYLISDNDYVYRKLTPVECERLQTVEDNWTAMVSNTQQYKMLGNGWTIDVIAHILKSGFLS